MKKFTGFMKKSLGDNQEQKGAQNNAVPQGDGPEAVVVREVMAFCEAGAPNSPNAGEEYVHLPAIVDATESSPAAAREASNCIRRYLSKDNFKRPFAQYNAIMLLRILTDNPGRDFTQHFDSKFVSTLKELLRETRDASVQQIARETLDYFEVQKMPGNETLGPLIEMWRKEKGKSARLSTPGVMYPQRQPFQAPPRAQNPRGLPPPDELAGRIEEAKTTARLLMQTIQSTPQHELMANDLVREFGDRAVVAHRSIQQYMACDNPPPDEDTMLTLIETNDQLHIAMSKHQRAILQARKAMGLGGGSPSPQPYAEANPNSSYFPTQQNNHQIGQNVYNQQERKRTPSPLPPQQKSNEFSSDFYAAPSGPPPSSQKSHLRANDFAHTSTYSAPPPRQPSPLQQSAPAIPPQSTPKAESGVENPFTDDAYVEPQQQASGQTKDRLSDRYVNNSLPQPPVGVPDSVPQAETSHGVGSQSRSQPPPPPPSHSQLSATAQDPSDDPRPIRPIQRTMSSDLYDDGDEDEPASQSLRPSGPGVYNDGYKPTPSFNARQEVSAATITMSGGSPPLEPQSSTIAERQQLPARELDSSPTDGVTKHMGALKV